MKNRFFVLVLAVLAFTCFGTFAEASSLCADDVKACNVGADPVDPTFKWMPGPDWSFVKTDKPFKITQTTGSKTQVTCNLPPGNVVAYPPDGGNPRVLACNNEIVNGRPTGTELPRTKGTMAEAVARILGDLQVEVSGQIEVVHSGTVNHRILPFEPVAPVAPVYNCGKKNKGCDDGPNWAKRILIFTGVALAGGAIYHFTKDKGGPPGAKTNPIKPTCTGVGCPGAPRTGSGS